MLSLAVGFFALSCVFAFYRDDIIASVAMALGSDRSAQFLLSLMYPLMLMMFLERNCPIPMEDKHALFNGVDDRAFETQDCFWIEIEYTNVTPNVCYCVFS